MIIEMLALMAKGLVGVVICGVFLTLMLSVWHVTNWIRRRHPKIAAWCRHITVAFVVLAVMTIILMVAGVAVETFFWR